MQKSIYERLFGLKPVINLCGPVTLLGGSTPPKEVVEAAAQASRYFVDLRELLKRSGELIARLLGVEAAYITSGAAAGISLATAACMTGIDSKRVFQLPNTEGMKNEVVVQRGHYNYNFMITLTGARIVYVGEEEPLEPFEPPEYPQFHTFKNRPEHIEAAISEKTCAIFHVISSENRLYNVPFGEVPLEKVAEIAKSHNIPLILDAANQVPPVSNFKKLIEKGADLAVFSGGKAIQCFNDTGIILGRKDLIDACAMNGPPNHAIGRGFKISKEQIVSLVVALQRYCSLDLDAELAKEKARAQYVINHCKGFRHVKQVELMYPDETGIHDRYCVLITLDEQGLGMKARDVMLKLQMGDPPIYTRGSYLHDGKIAVMTKILPDYKVLKIFIKRLEEVLTRS